MRSLRCASPLNSCFGMALLALAALLPVPQALAHPHVWIESRSEIVFDETQKITGLRVHWVFDEFYSTFTREELDENQNGTLDGAELSDLMRDSMQSLHPFNYFTFVQVNGISVAFQPATDYEAEFRDDVLSMTFFLPLEAAVDPTKDDFSYSSYDPSYYIAIEPVGQDALRLVGAGASACGYRRLEPDDPGIDTLSLPEAAFTGEWGNSSGIGSLFATSFNVSCATN